MHKIVCFCLIVIMVGCTKKTTTDDKSFQERINSFDKIESQMLEIQSKFQEPVAKDRVYYGLFLEREAIKTIAEGKFNTEDPKSLAIIRKLAWVALGEIQERRPEFQIWVQKKEPPAKGPENDKNR